MIASALLLLPLVLGAAQDPAARLRRGMEHWRAGEIEAAATEFRAANDAEPDNHLAAFDRGVAALTLQELDEARHALMTAALAPDTALAARARYHLGLVAAAEARAALGEQPQALEPDAREGVRGQLSEAERAFADSLALDPTLAEARHNLEVLRDHAYALETGWEEADHAALRAQADPFTWMAHLRDGQDALAAAAELQAEALPAPAWSEALRQGAVAQRRLADDARYLPDMLRAAFGGAEGVPAEQLDAVMETWRQASAAAAAAMEDAAKPLAARDPDGSRAAQAAATAAIEQVFRGLAPFEALLQAGIQSETAMVEGTAPEAPLPNGRVERYAERQRQVELWCSLLSLHAQQGLTQLPPPAPPEDDAAPSPDPTPANEQSPEEQRRAMFERAVELAPQAREAAAAALQALEAGDVEAARPHLQRTKELLEEIAPKSSEKGENEDESEEQQEQDEPQEQEPQDQEEPQDPEEEQPEQDPEDGEGEPPQEEQTRPLTPEELEKLLERAQEREQEYKDFLEELERRKAARTGRVERDW